MRVSLEGISANPDRSTRQTYSDGAVSWQPEGANKIVGADERVALGNLVAIDETGLNAKGMGAGQVALQHREALTAPGHRDAAALGPPRRHSRLRLESRIEAAGVVGQGDLGRGGPQLANQTRGMPALTFGLGGGGSGRKVNNRPWRRVQPKARLGREGG